jgi:hypothetical protein
MSLINKEIWKFELIAIALAAILYLCVLFIRLNILYFILYSVACSNISWLLWNGKKWWKLWILLASSHLVMAWTITIALNYVGNYSASAYSWIAVMGFLGMTIIYTILIPIFALAAYFSSQLVRHTDVTG